jgi:hypothetical protein
MPTIKIADDHHFVRQCKYKLYFLDINGKIRPHPEAFHLRPATATTPREEELSGVYYEWFDGTPAEKMAAVGHFIRIEIKKKDALLRLNAGLIRQQGATRSKRLRVSHEPEDVCPPYATIRGLPEDPDDELCTLLATLTLMEAVEFSKV